MSTKIHTKKIGLLFFLFVYLLNILFAVTPKAMAYGNALYNNDPKEIVRLDNDGNKAATMISNALTVQFLDASHIKVTLALKQPLVDATVANISYEKAYSGIYTLSDDITEWWSEPELIRSDGDSWVKAFGVLKTTKAPLKDNATEAEIQAWVSNLWFYPGIYGYDSGVGEASSIFVFVDEMSDGQPYKWSHQGIGDLGGSGSQGNIKKGFGSDAGYHNRDDYHGVTVKKVDSVENSLLNFVIKGEVIVDTYTNDTYVYCTATAGTYINYFKQDGCNNGGDNLITDKSWNQLTKEQLFANFNTPRYVTATLIDGDTSRQIRIAGSQSLAATTATGTGTGTGFGATGDDNVGCEASGNVLSWIICPVINGSLDGAAFIFHNFIEPYLQASPISTENTTENVVYAIWKSFRTIANIVLVFALLFIVFGQAIGGGLVDAYTAKKTMPRILVAAVLINLSIYICAIIIDIFNVLGNGMARLILSPLKVMENGENGLKIRPKAGESVAVGTTIILGVLIAGFAAILFRAGTAGGGAEAGGFRGVMVWVLVFVVLPVFIAAFAVFLTLLVRRAIILMLVIFSPVAMALFAIPSAEKYAKKWLDAFIKTMVVYPIITTIFAVSQVLAVMTYNVHDDVIGGSIVKLFAVMIIAFAPLFMIPFSFKLAGGIIGNVAGVVTSGRDKFKKMYGDDKNNHYSLRNRSRENIAHGLKHRTQMGAVNKAGALGRFLNEETKITAASEKVGKDVGSAIFDESLSSGRSRGEALIDKNNASAASMGAIKAGLDRNEAAEVGSIAGRLSMGGRYSAEAVAAGGSAATKAFADGYNADEARAAAEAAATMTMNKPVTKHTADQIEAASLGIAHAARTNAAAGRGARLSAQQSDAVVRASIAAHDASAKLNQSPAAKRSATVAAASAATDIVASNPGIAAPIFDQATAEAAKQAASFKITNPGADEGLVQAMGRRGANTVLNANGVAPIDPSPTPPPKKTP